MLTAAVRDLYHHHSDKYEIAVDTSCKEIWDNNPYLSDFKYSEKDGITISEEGDKVQVIDCHYPLINESNQKPYHFIHGYRKFLQAELGVHIPQGDFKGDIHLSENEKLGISKLEKMGIDNDFWIIAAGGKFDYSTKWWPKDYYQKVVDHFEGKITFVQIGLSEHHHSPLNNVINLIDKTSIREFILLVYHSIGTVSPISFPMHASAAVPTKESKPKNRAAVVIAGGREPPHWEAYPNHRFLSTNGALSCCDNGGCWKSRCHKVGDGDDKEKDENLCLFPILKQDNISYPKCMDMIKPQDVTRSIEMYYEGGSLKYNNFKKDNLIMDKTKALFNIDHSALKKSAKDRRNIYSIINKGFSRTLRKTISSICEHYGIDITFDYIENMTEKEIINLINNDDIIIQYNNTISSNFRKILSEKNCIYIDDFCLNDKDYTFDRKGWGIDSSFRKNTNWKKQITKLEFREFLKFINDNNLVYDKNVSDSDKIVYIPSRCWQETQNTTKILKSLNNTRISRIVIPEEDFPKKTIDIILEFASEIGLNVDTWDKKGIIPENGEYIVSDHMRTIISSLLAGNSVFSFANNITTGSHVTFECMNNSQLIESKEALPFNRDYVDSVLYKLLLGRVDSSDNIRNLQHNADLRSFLDKVLQ